MMASIYVASLSDYDSGILHGAWIDAAQDVDDILADIDRMLAASPTDPHAEDWAIHDYDGFGPLHLDEHEDLATVAGIARAIAELPEDQTAAFCAYVANMGGGGRCIDADWAVDRFGSVYEGAYDSLDDWAVEYVESTGLLDGVDDYLAQYIDFASFVREVDASGDIWTVEIDGMTHVYLYGRSRAEELIHVYRVSLGRV